MGSQAKVISPLPRDAGNGDLYALAQSAHQLAVSHAWKLRRPDGHWNGELLSNATITAEQVFFHPSLRPTTPIPDADADAYRHYLLSNQQPDGAWGIAPDHPGDVSTSAEAYLALKIVGVPPHHDAMRRGRAFIRRCGGVAMVRVFTRIFFAQFGLFPWDAVPQLPAEFILCPAWAPINVYRLSSWARSTLVPLLIIRHHQKIYPLPDADGRPDPQSTYLDELWIDPGNKHVQYSPSLLRPWESDLRSLMFGGIDTALYWLGGLKPFWPARRYARRKCVEWILERQEKRGGLGRDHPADARRRASVAAGGVQAGRPADPISHRRHRARHVAGRRRQAPTVVRLARVGHGPDDPGPVRRAGSSGSNKEEFEETEERGQQHNDERLRQTVRWIKTHQLLGPEGDWRIYNPALAPGGFSFEYSNTWYPDVDDTAAAILALVNQDPAGALDSATVTSAAAWICGMQNQDGGWAAFDLDNDRLWLNSIPFSDMDALCNPSSADVTGRILEAFGLMQRLAAQGEFLNARTLDLIGRACPRGVAYLLQQQEASGSWYDRWGSNYIYGTSNVLCGVTYFSEGDEEVEDAVQAAAGWLENVQNADARRAGPSTPPQTAWALMGLLAVCNDETSHAIESGIGHLVETQAYSGSGGEHISEKITATWTERQYTGTGFPNFFYIGYSLYRHYFPIMALGRYLSAFKKVQPDEKVTIDSDAGSRTIFSLEEEMLESPMDSGYSDTPASCELKVDLKRD
ncbi:prenyltransferase and squalene oxidase repeat protein [Apiospora aurea]|uniref:Prenyltransferase and squalene oxidase repeat protein n=1 Tax=Apiospora aurea TaxID=335848 RepID=A0ABR1Q347_9PEZI